MLKLFQSKRIRSALITAALLISALALIAAPSEAMEGAKEGLHLCFNVIVPSLFPFFVLSSKQHRLYPSRVTQPSRRAP